MEAAEAVPGHGEEQVGAAEEGGESPGCGRQHEKRERRKEGPPCPCGAALAGAAAVAVPCRNDAKVEALNITVDELLQQSRLSSSKITSVSVSGLSVSASGSPHSAKTSACLAPTRIADSEAPPK